jgi:hypothetical protein
MHTTKQLRTHSKQPNIKQTCTQRQTYQSTWNKAGMCMWANNELYLRHGHCLCGVPATFLKSSSLSHGSCLFQHTPQSAQTHNIQSAWPLRQRSPGGHCRAQGLGSLAWSLAWCVCNHFVLVSIHHAKETCHRQMCFSSDQNALTTKKGACTFIQTFSAVIRVRHILAVNALAWAAVKHASAVIRLHQCNHRNAIYHDTQEACIDPKASSSAFSIRVLTSVPAFPSLIVWLHELFHQT